MTWYNGHDLQITVEAEESPAAACRREVAEEAGLVWSVGRILAVDWVPSRPERPEGVVVIYDGGVLTSADIATIRLLDGELARFEFVQPGEVPTRVSPLLGRRIIACLNAVADGMPVSLENGSVLREP